MTDLINRSDAIDRITNQYLDSDGGRDRYAVGINVGLTKAMNALKDMPSAEPERKHGYWAIGMGDYENEMIYRCMECGHQFKWLYDSRNPPVFNYCQKCGADMRGETDGNRGDL